MPVAQMALLVSGTVMLFSSMKRQTLAELITPNFTGKKIPLLHNKYLNISPFIPTPSSGFKKFFCLQ
jgi:hypothetical protein